jgi:hypothetical protein
MPRTFLSHFMHTTVKKHVNPPPHFLVIDMAASIRLCRAHLHAQTSGIAQAHVPLHHPFHELQRPVLAFNIATVMTVVRHRNNMEE